MLRKKIGAFYLIEHIGSGGMSDVYLALNPRTREKRAMKILAKRATSAPSFYARFLREVEIVRGLEHRNIVRIYESGQLEDCYYYSMEYLAGGNLARRMGKRPTALGDALQIITEVCRAVAYAHEKGIIHRDLKPANVLLDFSGNPKLTDFGIAKSLEDHREILTRSGEILGTIAYLAPEQRFNTKRVDRRADVYALGSMIYEMLMGFPPLGKFPWPREIQPDFPEPVQSIIEKCLAIEPDRRYLDAGYLLLDLENCSLRSGREIDKGNHRTSSTQAEDEGETAPLKMDRIEGWFQTLRIGTTRERLATVREMVEKTNRREASAIIKLYSSEGDRVRWGLIRMFGDLRIKSALPLLIKELRNPFQSECAIEALGKIGDEEAFNPILENLMTNPKSAIFTLLPLAQTGRERALPPLRHYLTAEVAVIRLSAVRAIAMIASEKSLEILREHLSRESDESIRTAAEQCIRRIESTLICAQNSTGQNTEILAVPGNPIIKEAQL